MVTIMETSNSDLFGMKPTNRSTAWRCSTWWWLPILAVSFGVAHAQSGTEVLVEVLNEFRQIADPHEAAEEFTVAFSDLPGRISVSIVRAQSRHGQVRAQAFANVEGINNGTETRAIARFHDTLVIQAPVPPGTFGFFRASFEVDGTLEASGYNLLGDPITGGGAADYQARFRADTDAGVFTRTLSAIRTSGRGLEGTESGSVVRQVAFLFGEPFEISFELSVSARASAAVQGAGGVARAAYGSSGYWTGLNEVFTIDEQPVAEFTVTSASGTDYRTDFRPRPAIRLLAPQRSGNTLRMSLQTEVDQTYLLQAATDLKTRDWQDIAVVLGDGEMQTLEVPIHSQTSPRFFRLAQP